MMRRWSLDRPVGQAERNDGIHAATGLVVRHLVDLEWSRSWLASVSDDRLDAMDEAEVTELGRHLDEIDGHEIRYLACSPEAREVADIYMSGMTLSDQDDQFAWWKLLACPAQVIDDRRRLERWAPEGAAAIETRAGRCYGCDIYAATLSRHIDRAGMRRWLCGKCFATITGAP